LEANQPDNSKQQNSNENPHKISQVIIKINFWAEPIFRLTSHGYLSDYTKQCVLEGKIHIGMEAIAVVASWGRPNDINRSVGSWGIHEQWVYGGYPSSSKATYVYFEDARVTSWQD
jgi:hypothetical protein